MKVSSTPEKLGYHSAETYEKKIIVFGGDIGPSRTNNVQ